MGFDPGLELGDIITNDSMRKIFVCGNMGGMRRSKSTNTLIIISDHTKGLYEDKWVGDVLYYTGMGKREDQDINSSQNRTLNESNNNGVDVFLFEVFKANNYIYRGQVKLLEKPYQEKQKDEDGILRNVWIFPVIPMHNHKVSIDKKIINENYAKKERKAKRLSNKELQDKAKESQSSKTSIRTTTTQTYERNAFVTEFAKRRAKGICQLCNKSAPFNNKGGEPYLETHHIEWLSRGGSDTIDNTAALCPNCHKKMHVLDMESDIKILKGKIKY
ncbi:TPA: HNH endonuclease [Clostridium botulinum]|uniref:HNH endonuclease n=1 Tax=Clostridium botulinum TaxID=1491 RepID=UPI0008FCB5E7|nr:HNH endonuclease [Clostridium botulinum]APC78881.1 HNH endonuclease family protein [Clostridium botulinum]APU61312.1 HNH endonuclease family protein [Clostridium botulinum]MCS4447325.1 HNH endonuclease [Clostridium botulinum]MCS4456714.1 HNH endonuclease [Clostridium botulinum]MCS4460517.1 HNH endonuclease [Clostridium botulinum]